MTEIFFLCGFAFLAGLIDSIVLGSAATGTVVVPAGEYTLFSVPDPRGGVSIVNKQRGQNGTSYDSAQDLGRVRMRRANLPAAVERFTIKLNAPARLLRLQWDQTEFLVPLAVR